MAVKYGEDPEVLLNPLTHDFAGRADAWARLRAAMTPDEVATEKRLLEPVQRMFAAWDTEPVEGAVKFEAQHFGGDRSNENLLAHMRLNDRVGPNGERLLHGEEFQSDWGQKGREKGFAASDRGAAEAETARLYDEWQAARDAWDSAEMESEIPALERAKEQAWARYNAAHSSLSDTAVPPAPFVTKTDTWLNLLLKRMLRIAAEEGYDGITWTKGIQQVDRYQSEFRQRVDRVDWEMPMGHRRFRRVRFIKGEDTLTSVDVLPDGKLTETIRMEGGQEANTLADLIGKDAAAQVMEGDGLKGSISSADLTIGGEGMKGFYDKIVVNTVNKLGKKYGARVGETRIGIEDGNAGGSPKEYAAINEAWKRLKGDDEALAALDAYSEWAFPVVDEAGNTPTTDIKDFWAERTDEASLRAKAAIEEELSGAPVHYLPMTPELRKSLLTEGRPLFSRRPTEIPRPDMPEPSRELSGQESDLIIRVILNRGEYARGNLEAFRAEHPELVAWRQYRNDLADAELLQAQAEAQAKWEAGAPAREAAATAKQDRYDTAKATGKRLPKDESAENFQKWFAGSVITKDGEPDGKPLRVTHETGQKFDRFSAGEFGFHFGVGIPEGMFGDRRLRGYLHIENPYRMRDLGIWTPEAVIKEAHLGDDVLAEVERIRAENGTPSVEMVDAAYRKDRAKGEELRKIREADAFSEAGMYHDRRGNYLASKPVHDALKEQGYDGIVYANDAEGRSDSYIIFDPEQFKASRNVGTWDASDPRFMFSRRTTEDIATNLIRVFRGGDLGTIGLDVVEAVLGEDAYRNLARQFDNENGVPTEKGKKQIAEAWRWYLRTRLGPDGRVRRAFDRLFVGLSQVWFSARGRTGGLPHRSMVLLDTIFRPDLIAESELVRVGVRPAERDFDKVTVPEGEMAEVHEETVRRVGQAREAGRVGTRREDLLAALDLRTGQELPVHEVLARAIAYVQAEQFRKVFGGGENVPMTKRSVVPASRVKRIQRDVGKMVTDYLGSTAEEIKVEGGELLLSPEQQAGVRAMANEVGAHPMGNIIPDRFLDGSPLDRVPIKEWNYLMEAVIDSQAGVAARRSGKAEAVPPALGYAIWRWAVGAEEKRASPWRTAAWTAAGAAIGGVTAGPFGAAIFAAGGGLAIGFKAQIKEWLITARSMEGKVDPHVVELLRDVERELNLGGSQLVRELGDFRKAGGDLADGRALFDKLGSTIVPPVALDVIDDLYDIYKATRNAEEPLSVDDLLDRRAQVARALGDPNTKERKVLVYLEWTAKNDKGWDPDTMAEAVQVIQEGVERRWRQVQNHSTNLAMSLQGAPRTEPGAATKAVAGIRETMTPQDDLRIYTSFFNGDWKDLGLWLSRRGRETGLETARKPDVDLGQVFFEMILRLRAQEVINRFVKRLALYGVLGETHKLFEEFDLGESGLDRSAFIDDVVHYINLELQWKANVIFKGGVVVEKPPAPESVGKPFAGPEGSYEPRFRDKPPGVGNAHQMLAFTKAHEILASYGYKRGLGLFDRWRAPDGTEVLLSQEMIESLDTAVDDAASLGKARGARGEPLTTRGAEGARKVGVLPLDVPERPLKVKAEMKADEAIDALLRMFPATASMIRSGVTVGPFGVATPAYFVTAGLGAGLQTYQRMGVRGVLSAGFAEPRATAGVMARIWGKGRRWEGGAVIVTPDGRIYTADMLADLALSSSFIKAETTRTIAANIRDEMRPTWKKVVNAPKFWNKVLQEAATAVDNHWRVGIFIDELKRGRSPAEAAKTARSALFDYSDLTPVEKRIIRNVVMFYSFARKNAALFFDTLLRNPHRILGQLRLTNGLHEWFMEDGEPDIQVPEWYDMRLYLAMRGATKETARNRGVLTLSPVTPLDDALGMWVDIFDMVGSKFEDKQATRQVVSRMTPWTQAPLVMATDVELFSGRDLDKAKEVPHWFIETDLMLTGGVLVNDIFDVKWEDHPDPAKWSTSDDPRVYTAQNGEAWWWARNFFHFMPGMGRSMDTLTTLDRMNFRPFEVGVIDGSRALHNFERRHDIPTLYEAVHGVEQPGLHPSVGDTAEPRYGMTTWDETFTLLGVRGFVVPTYGEARDRFGNERQRAADDLLKGAPQGATGDYVPPAGP